MKNRVSDILIIALFIAFVGGICAAQALLPDGAVSAAERRKLAQAPEFSVQAVFSGKFAEDAEKYLADQFPLRQQFRTLKAAWQFGVFRAKDNDGVYIAGNSVYSLAKPLEEAQTEALISNTNAVYKKYLSGLKTYFAAVPDKSRGEAEKYGYPEVDHEALDRLLKDGLDAGIKYLGFSPCAGLTADDYYRTDLHWRQERLQPVLDALGAAMDFAPPDISGWQADVLSPFYGVYCGQSALDVGYDSITCLSSAAVDASAVTGAEFAGEKAVYDPADAHSLDGYNIFLGGAQAVLTVVNPAGKTGRELYIFRDSFASSLAPLLLESYDRITLIDLRYIAADLVGEYVDFAPGADALFLYSAEVLQNGMLLK
jgi:hypothetical protein